MPKGKYKHKPPTCETRAKISKTNIGKICTPEHRVKTSKSMKGRQNALGYRHTLKQIQKFSFARARENNPNWQNGKSFELYSPGWNEKLREQIRARDNYTCQECGRHQDEFRTKTNRRWKLIPHHIDYCKKNNVPTNLISLCLNCHMKTSYNRKDWAKYFRIKLNSSRENK